MRNYIAFLRGINVGGNNIIKMADLSLLFESTGLSEVKTFIQSGNVLFHSDENNADNLRMKLEDQLEKVMGKRITIILRTKDQIENIISINPFIGDNWDADTKLYVCFLDKKPNINFPMPLKNDKEALVLIRIIDSDAFLVSLPMGQGHFGFPNPFIEKELKVLSTSRNWTTVNKIAELL